MHRCFLGFNNESSFNGRKDRTYRLVECLNIGIAEEVGS